MFLIYILIAILPSIVWLIFYLREDVHPEPKKMILITFVAGALSAPAALIAEFIASFTIDLAGIFLNLNSVWRDFLFFFFGVAFVEEYSKYRAVRAVEKAHDEEFDEPTDLMIYMIISALGFTAVENISFLLPSLMDTFGTGIIQTFLRFLGATLLHVLASGIIGYFLALGLFKPKRWAHFFAAGFFIAVPLHWLFNQIIIISEKRSDPYIFIYEAALISIMSVFVAIAFRHLRSLKLKKAS